MRALLDLVLPTACAACGRPGPAACGGCAAALTAPARPAWPRPSPPGLPPPFAVAAYDGSVRSFLLAYKERGIVELHRPLGAALARAVTAAQPAAARPTLLVPVPSSARARRDRGDDVVARLARTAAGVLRADGRLVHVVPAVRHRRRVVDSAGLSAAHRAANLSGAFGCRRGAAPKVAGALVVVVDDLVTTGATLTEVAITLRAAGALVVGAATVAATNRRPGAGSR